jgi:hypothetical protein
LTGDQAGLLNGIFAMNALVRPWDQCYRIQSTRVSTASLYQSQSTDTDCANLRSPGNALILCRESVNRAIVQRGGAQAGSDHLQQST